MELTKFKYQYIEETRKDHTCVWCGELIPKGWEAVYHVYTIDGGFCADYYHDECADAAKEIAEFYGTFTFDPGDFHRGGTEPR